MHDEGGTAPSSAPLGRQRQSGVDKVPRMRHGQAQHVGSDGSTVPEVGECRCGGGLAQSIPGRHQVTDRGGLADATVHPFHLCNYIRLTNRF